MADWKKLNKEFDDYLDNMTDEDWNYIKTKPKTIWQRIKQLFKL